MVADVRPDADSRNEAESRQTENKKKGASAGHLDEVFLVPIPLSRVLLPPSVQRAPSSHDTPAALVVTRAADFVPFFSVACGSLSIRSSFELVPVILFPASESLSFVQSGASRSQSIYLPSP